MPAASPSGRSSAATLTATSRSVIIAGGNPLRIADDDRADAAITHHPRDLPHLRALVGADHRRGHDLAQLHCLSVPAQGSRGASLPILASDGPALTPARPDSALRRHRLHRQADRGRAARGQGGLRALGPKPREAGRPRRRAGRRNPGAARRARRPGVAARRARAVCRGDQLRGALHSSTASRCSKPPSRPAPTTWTRPANRRTCRWPWRSTDRARRPPGSPWSPRWASTSSRAT